MRQPRITDRPSEFFSVQAFEPLWQLQAFVPAAFESISGPCQRFIKVAQVARIRHPREQYPWIGGGRDPVGSVVNVHTLNNARHMAIETRGLTRVVAAVGGRSFLRLKILVAREAGIQVLFAIGRTGVRTAHVRIMAMRAFEFAHAGARILFQRLERIVQRRTIGPSAVQTGHVTRLHMAFTVAGFTSESIT